jgi:fermentation-respiration switch protein FrsA (DUF1100 family)
MARARLRTLVLSVAALLVALYAAVLLYFRLNEDHLVFYPERGPLAPPPPDLQLASRDVHLRAADQVALVARLIPPPPEVPAAEAGWLLYLHGNGGNVGDPGYNRAWAKFHRLGLGVLAVDYRGYGQSAGTPSEQGFYRDADAAYDYLTSALEVPARRLVIYGYSLGAAVAIDLGARVPAAGLMVEGPFLSIPAMGAELYPFLPASLLARNRFASVDKIARVSMPKLFLHARTDEVVPFRQGERLFALAVPPKLFKAVAGGHMTAHDVDPAFFQAVRDFVTGLGLPVTTTAAAAGPSR